MTKKALSIDDYPLAEKRPELVSSFGCKDLDEITIEAVISGQVSMADLRITPQALQLQAEIARSADRNALAENFERASEMSRLPQSLIMEIYELLRPGRAERKRTLIHAAARLRDEFDAERL
ncbi:MAG: diol dehydratase small subunit, partial [Kiloniellales bacterium]|nr:diol dehydratase small subunit [Kiloniellales bacterium]